MRNRLGDESVRLGHIAVHSKISGRAGDCDVKAIQILFGNDLAPQARPAAPVSKLAQCFYL